MNKSGKTPLRKVYILPNLFTALNLILGMVAIFKCIEGEIVQACWWVVLAGVLDGLDGAVARLTHSQSDFGVEFDSLADLVSFGAAPAVIAYSLLHETQASHLEMILGISAIFTACGALRLARYNIQIENTERKGFLGLPIPAAALALLFYVLLLREYQLQHSSLMLLPGGNPPLTLGKLVSTATPFFMLGLALLMVSEVPYAKVTRFLRIRRRASFDTLVSLILISVLLVALKSDMRILAGFLFMMGYVLYGLFRYLYKIVATAQQEKAVSTRS